MIITKIKNFYNTKFLVGPGAYLVPARKIIPGRILYTQPSKWFFTPEQPLHPGLTQNYSVPFTQNALNTAAEPLRTKFSGEPDPYYSCKTFRFAQPGESNRISAHLWISIDSHRQKTKFAAFPSALKREINIVHYIRYDLPERETGHILTFIQGITKRDLPCFRKVSFSFYPCADERNQSAPL